jgi:hypothetical protein
MRFIKLQATFLQYIVHIEIITADIATVNLLFLEFTVNLLPANDLSECFFIVKKS